MEYPQAHLEENRKWFAQWKEWVGSGQKLVYF